MNRQQRRALGKTHSPASPLAAVAGLGAAAGKLQEFIEAHEQMTLLSGQLETVLGQVQDARDAFAGYLTDAKYEAQKQRMVSLRLVGTVNPVDPTDVTALLALEEQYRAEYDAIQALIQLVQK